LLKSIGKYLPLVNKIFGLLFLVVAIWLLERILSEQVSAFLWTTLSLASLLYLNTSNNLKSILKPLFSKLISLILIIYSGLQFYGISNNSSYNPSTSFIENKSNIVFTKVYDTKNLYENINNVENITMIDLYADWCVACKELEKYTFTDPRVEKILSKINLVKYDITKTSEDSTAFLSKHKLFGPPAILFYENNGIEIRNARIVGFVDAETFLNKIDDIAKKL
jgi:thiol:disulfide interchange protein DsbD